MSTGTRSPCAWLYRAATAITLTAGLAVGTTLFAHPQPAGAAPVEGAEYVAGSSKVLGSASKLFELGGIKDQVPFVAGLALASDVLNLIGVFGSKPAGPSIKDVLNKLNSMTQQLNTIQNQLSNVQSQLTSLQAAIAQLIPAVQASTCTTANVLQTGAVSPVNLLGGDYQQLVADEAALPSAQNPNEAVATLDQSWNEFADNVLGQGNSLLISSWPMAQQVNAIHTALMGNGPSQDGVIKTCAPVAFTQWQSQRRTDPKIGWVDDRGYYQGIDDLVRWYQSYEVQALGYIEESGNFRAGELYARNYPEEQLDLAQRSAICQLAFERHPESLSAKLCRSVSAEVRAVRKDIGSEYELAGVPYSDSRVILSLASSVRGSGSAQPILWVRDPGGLPDGKGFSNFTDLPTMTSFDHLQGWRIATNQDWTQLFNSRVESGGSATQPILAATQQSGAFTGVMPKLPLDTERIPNWSRTNNVFGAAKAFFWSSPGHTTIAKSSQSEQTVRCTVSPAVIDAFVLRQANLSGLILCSPGWLQHGLLASDYVPRINNSAADPQSTLAAVSPTEVVATEKSLPGWGHHVGPPLTAWTPIERLEWTIPVPDTTVVDGKTVSCLNPVGVPRPCGANFSSWMDQTFSDPSRPSPVPTGRPTMAQRGSTTACDPRPWKAGPAALGKIDRLPSTFTGQWATPNSNGNTTRTVQVPAGQAIDDSTFATDGGFSASQPFRLTCTVSAQWAEQVNTGSAQSSVYQLTPNGTTPVLTEVPAAPTDISAIGASGSAHLSLKLGPTYGSSVVSYTVTPYVNNAPKTPITVSANTTDAPGDFVSISVPATGGSTYRYGVAVNVRAGTTSVTVVGAESSLSTQVVIPAS